MANMKDFFFFFEGVDYSKSKFTQAVEEYFAVTRRITGHWCFETTVDLIIKQ